MPVELVLFVLRLAFVFALYFFILLVTRVMSRELTARAGESDAPIPTATGAGAGFGAASATPGEAYLLTIDGAESGLLVGTTFVLAPGVGAGRNEANRVHLPDVYTSGDHARFRYERGRWLLEDLGSMNGSYVNGQRVSGTVPLGDGDTVQLGRVVTQFLLRPPQ